MKYNKLPLKKLGITSSFEEHKSRGTFGQDFGWFDYQGEPIYAINDGTVMEVSYNESCGNYCWIKHDYDSKHDLWSRYLHMKEKPSVKVGQAVKREQQIGKMGNTGDSTGTHLHFETWLVPKGWKFNWNDRSKYVVKGTDYVFAFDDQYIGKDDVENNKAIIKVVGTSKIVKRDTTKNQIEVVGSLLRCRKGAGTNQNVLGYIDYGIYDYTETKDNGGYTWYNLGFGWIAGLKDDTKVYPLEEPKPTPVPEPVEDDKDKKIEELTIALNEQKRLVEQLKEENDKLHIELDKVANLKVFVANTTGYYYIKLNKNDKIYK